MIFTAKFRPGLCDAGLGGEIKNISILKMLEDTAGFHSDSVQDGINEMDTKKTAWVIMAWRLHVIRRPHYGQELTVETWSRPMERAHAFRDFRLKSESGEVLAIASSKWSLISTETRRLVRLTEEFNRRYSAEDMCVFDSWRPKRFAPPETYAYTSDYRVMRRDTDIIGHMHNLNYLALAYEVLPDDVYFAGEMPDVEISYRSEIKLGDNIKLCRFSDNGAASVALTGEKGLCACVRMW